MTSGRSAAGWAAQSKSSSVLRAGNWAWRIRWRAPECVAGEDLGFQERLEELLVGPLFGTGPLCGLLEPLEYARRL